MLALGDIEFLGGEPEGAAVAQVQEEGAVAGVVVEAAGNGSQNLDDAVYGQLFNREYRDSGAIMCGATTIGGTPYDWSNNGSRVDLNGWGGSVGTCGYGDLQDDNEDVFYTRYFSGTSSASPIEWISEATRRA